MLHSPTGVSLLLLYLFHFFEFFRQQRRRPITKDKLQLFKVHKKFPYDSLEVRKIKTYGGETLCLVFFVAHSNNKIFDSISI